MEKYQLESTECPSCGNVVWNVIFDDGERGCGQCGHKYVAKIRTVEREEYEKELSMSSGMLSNLGKLFKGDNLQ